jgi:hypothetical protein
VADRLAISIYRPGIAGGRITASDALATVTAAIIVAIGIVPAWVW